MKSSANPRGGAATEATSLLRQALGLHQAGRLGEAETLYRRALGRDGSLADGHHLLGLALHQQGRSLEGLAAIGRALERAPLSPTYHLSQGATLAALGQIPDALRAFRRVLALRPADALAFRNLATASLDAPEAALASARRSVGLERRDATAWTALAHAARKLGRDDELRSACRAALALDANQAEARFLLEGLEGAPARPPPAYVRELFDKFAPHFDRDLERLDYQTPQALARLVETHLKPAQESLAVLDLGCGTGLAGVALAPLARRMVGLDLSPAMLAEARNRRLYAELIEADLVAHRFRERFDLAIAADVLNYLGDLAPAFAAIDAALAPQGALAFSIEALAEGGPYRLSPDLRYAHAPNAVRALGEAQGWSTLAQEPSTLRRQGKEPVAGVLFLFRKSQS
jgi:predicted TPR repeat methyltransferase